MRILFDHNVPVGLARRFLGHEVELASARGWEAKSNGVLLSEAERAGFEVLLTCDQSLPYQQNLQGRTIAVVILPTNNMVRLRINLAAILSGVDFAQPGQVVRVTLNR